MADFNTCADPETLAIVRDMMDQFHEELLEAEVTVGVEFAHPSTDAETESGVVLKLSSYPCLAVCELTKARQRMRGAKDVYITIAARDWEGMSPEEKAALVDHELCHVELDLDPDGFVQGDKAGRPKLKMRLHNMIVGGFREVVNRHGEAAPEVGQVRKILEDLPAARPLFLFEGASMSRVPDRGLQPTTVTLSAPGQDPVTVTGEQFHRAVNAMTGANA